MFLLRNSLVTTLIISASYGGTAIAEETKGFYLTVGGGTNIVQDTDWDETLDGEKYKGDVELDSKFSIDGGIGYDFGKWRTELTYQSMPTDLDTISAEKVIGSVGVTATASGDVDVTSYMATVYYDLPDYEIGNKTLVPYLGAGIGTTNIDVGTITVDSVSTGGGDDDTTSYQLKLGSSLELSKKADLYVEGVYFATGDFNVLDTDFDPIQSFGARSGVRFRF